MHQVGYYIDNYDVRDVPISRHSIMHWLQMGFEKEVNDLQRPLKPQRWK